MSGLRDKHGLMLGLDDAKLFHRSSDMREPARGQLLGNAGGAAKLINVHAGTSLS